MPQIADSLLPVAAALVALLFVFLLARSYWQRPAGQKALWAAGFAFFAVATVCEAVAQRAGWTPTLFRTYYLAGGVLTVAYLGAGSAWLLLRREGRDVLLGALAVGSIAAAVSVWLAPVDARMLATTASGRPPDEQRAGRACVPLGRRPQLGWDRGADRRIAVLDRPAASRQRQRLDRLWARSSSRSRPGSRAPATTRSSTSGSSSGSRSCSAGSRSPAERSSPRRFAGPRPPRRGRLSRDDDRAPKPCRACRDDRRERLTRTRGRLRSL